MDRAKRRELVQSFLVDLRAQREVDIRDALEEVIHLVFEVDDELKSLDDRVARIEGRAAEERR